jgi:hypothetical protein
MPANGPKSSGLGQRMACCTKIGADGIGQPEEATRRSTADRKNLSIKDGGQCRIRTCDLLLVRQAL